MINQKAFNQFREAVLERSGSYITIDELYILIERYTYMQKKRYFGFKKDSIRNSRLKYHRYWIKLLEGQGILIPSEKFGVWRVRNIYTENEQK